MHARPRLLFVLLLVALAACDSGGPDAPGGSAENLIVDLAVRLNPTGAAPLAAKIDLTTDRDVSVEVLIEGRDGPETEVRYRPEGFGRTHEVPVVGLYPDADNVVQLTFFDAAGTELGRTSRTITTAPLLADLPAIRIDAREPAAMTPGFNLVSYFGHNGSFNPQRPFFFDPAGTIRWYLDLAGHPELRNLFYDNGIERLQNGNLYFGDGATDRIYEIDLFGEVLNTWAMPGFGFHHNVIEKPGGNFLVTVNRDGSPTVEDVVIEIDRGSGEVIREWDLNDALDNQRRAWPTNLADLNVDWFHANALAYDPSDDTIIVSGRTQGTVKLTRDNEVVWILAPHRGWATAGDGTDLTTRLLQPLDADGRPISDPDVLDGTANHPDFEWAWYQHAPALLPDGTLILFDNGDNRNYGTSEPYSRAVGYRIDADAMTIQQTWQYGRERGAVTYSRIVSDVDYHPAEDHVVFMPGAVQFGSAPYGKVIEVDRSTRQVVFEATVTPPIAPFGITFHRVERLPLYPTE